MSFRLPNNDNAVLRIQRRHTEDKRNSRNTCSFVTAQRYELCNFECLERKRTLPKGRQKFEHDVDGHQEIFPKQLVLRNAFLKHCLARNDS